MVSKYYEALPFKCYLFLLIVRNLSIFIACTMLLGNRAQEKAALTIFFKIRGRKTTTTPHTCTQKTRKFCKQIFVTAHSRALVAAPGGWCSCGLPGGQHKVCDGAARLGCVAEAAAKLSYRELLVIKETLDFSKFLQQVCASSCSFLTQSRYDQLHQQSLTICARKTR